MTEDATLPAAHEGVVGSELASQTMVMAARRYERLTEIARGGTGRIVAARDRVFDRAVAIKEPLDPRSGGARLHAEAEVLASLQHPSIVPVYDTGAWSDGVPFFAMKLVDGRSLRELIRDAPALEQRLALIPQLVAVSDAIAYAHSQGVIHRDLKPGNVLIGPFGETVVIDWGLAKRIASEIEPPDAARIAADGGARAPIDTATGAVLGTPAYMAPEQARGERVDERADVYALGAMLYHLLTGEPPFHGACGDVIAAVDAGPAPIVDRQPRAPVDLAAIATKAMARDPAQRYRSAAALADDLRRFQTGRLVSARRYSVIARLRRRLRRHRGVVLGVALAAASAGAAILAMPSTAPPGAQCARSADRIRGLWDPDHRLPDRSIAVRAALAASGRASAADTFARVSAQLDRYGRGWAAARVEACQATARGEQSGTLLDLRMACLDRRLDDVDALVRELATPRPTLVDKAVEATGRLPLLAACSDTRALQAVVQPPADPVARAAVDAANRRLSTVKALATTGAYRDALALATDVARDAEAIGHPPLVADALYWRAQLEDTNADSTTAEATLRRALLAAADGHSDVTAAWLWAHLIFVVGDSLKRPDDALAMRTAAEAAVRRTGRDPDSDARVADAIGTALRAAGKFAAAIPYTERALALREQLLGPDHLDVGIALVNLSNAESSLDRGDAARAKLVRARGIFERALGPDHPHVAFTENNLGGIYYEAGELDRAIVSFDRAIAIRERSLGLRHARLGPSLVNRSLILHDVGRSDDAVADLDRAVEIFTAARGPDHPDVGQALYHRGEILLAQGKLDAARADLTRALTITERALGPDHADLGFILVNLGELAWHARDHAEARRLLGRARTVWQTALGATHPYLGFVLADLALIALSENDPAAARPLAERAAQLQARRPQNLARNQFILARALWSSPADRPRARTLALSSRDIYARLGAARSHTALELAAWLAAHDLR